VRAPNVGASSSSCRAGCVQPQLWLPHVCKNTKPFFRASLTPNLRAAHTFEKNRSPHVARLRDPTRKMSTLQGQGDAPRQ
jgi:hypothetical protein